jgi:Uma2 family endonuclease
MPEAARPLVFPDREDVGSWPAPGQWTYADYCRLPDDGRRYEVIRGFLYVSPAPSVTHQRAVRQLFRRLDGFVLAGGLGEVLMAPVDILLPKGIASPVQPDLVFFRTGNQPGAEALNFKGVPDLVVEVLSPGTRRYDQGVKLAAYREAGIPEVWFPNPRSRTLSIFGLGEDGESYAELSRGGMGETVVSRVLPGLRIEVAEIFPR